MSKGKYHPPTEFAVFPVMGYWEIRGKPVSSKEGVFDLYAEWKESEVARKLHLHMGWWEEEECKPRKLSVVLSTLWARLLRSVLALRFTSGGS